MNAIYKGNTYQLYVSGIVQLKRVPSWLTWLRLVEVEVEVGSNRQFDHGESRHAIYGARARVSSACVLTQQTRIGLSL